jgi:hypothetical protein
MDAPDAEVIQAIQERLASDTRYLDTLRETEQRRAAMQQSYTTGVPHDLSTNPPPRLNPEQIDMYNAATPSMLLRFAAEGDQQAAALYMAQFGQAQRAMFPLTTTFEGQLRAATQYADPEMLGLQPGVHYGEADIPTPIRLNVIQQHFIWRDTLRNRLFTSIEQTMPTIGRPLLDLQAWVAGNGAVQAMSTFGPSLGASIYYGPQLLNLASKIPEDLVFLAQLYGPQYVGTPGAEGTAYGFYQGMEFGAPVTQHPMYALSDAEKAQYAKLQSDALEVQRQHREDFELFIRHGDPRGPIESVIVHGRGGGVVQERRRDSVDWSRVFGRVTFSPEPGLEGWTNALITSQGIAGLGATFTLHPERFDQFINDVARGDALGPEAGHQAYIAAMIKYEDIYAEMAVQIVSDPLNFAGPLGNIITKVLFPPAILFEPVLKGVLGRIVSPRRLQAGQATVAGIEEYMSSTSFFYRIAKRQLHSHAVDATIDSLNTLLLNYNPLLDGDGLTFWRRVLLGDTDWLTSKGLGRGQIDQILDLARLFKEHKLADLTDVFTSNRAMRSGIWTETVASLAEQEGLDLADPAAKEMLAEIVTRYARNDPHNLKTVFAQVYSELMRRRLGLRTYPRGSVARFFLTSGQLLKEQWLMLSIKFWTANGLSNVSNALAAGYVINPFDLGAATRIAEIFERSYRIGMPNEVMRSFWMDALEGGEGHLLSSLVPIPGYGEMSKAIPATLEFLGAQVPKRLTEFLGTEPALLRALDKINVSRLMQAGGDLSSAVERTARAQIFIKAFTDELEIRIRPQIAAELAQDAAAPSSLVEGVRLGTIRNVSDIEDDFRANYINNRRPMHRISLMRPEGIDAYNSHIETLTRRLDEIQAKYIDAYDNPLFRQEVRDAYANAQVALGRDFEALNDFLRQQVPDFERFDRMMQEGMGVTPKAHPAPLEHYENRLRWLKERDQAATAARGVGGAAAPVSPAPQITPTEVAPRPFQAGRRPVQVRDAITGRQGGEVLSEALGRTPVRRLEGETGHAYLLRRYGSVEAANDALERLGFSVDDFGGLGGSAYDDIAQWLQGHDSTILKGTYVPGSTGINYTRGIHIPEAPPGVVAEPASSIYFTQLDAGRIQINSETRITREGVAEFGERLARDGAPLDTKVRITPRRLAQEFGAEELTLRDIIGEEAAQRIEGVTPPSAAAEMMVSLH